VPGGRKIHPLKHLHVLKAFTTNPGRLYTLFDNHRMDELMRFMQDAFQDWAHDRGPQLDLLHDFLRVLRQTSGLIFGQPHVNHTVFGGCVIVNELHSIHNSRFTMLSGIASFDSSGFWPKKGS
jgi:hypothetical protein